MSVCLLYSKLALGYYNRSKRREVAVTMACKIPVMLDSESGLRNDFYYCLKRGTHNETDLLFKAML